MTYTTEQLYRVGGHVNNNKFFFHVIISLFGFVLDRYNTGNLQHATLRGEHLSNYKANMIIQELRSGCHVWYGLDDHKFHGVGFKTGKYVSEKDFLYIVDAIKSIITQGKDFVESEID